MTTGTVSADVVTDLRSRMRGVVAEPGDPEYPRLVAGFHLAFEHTPPVVVEPADVADVRVVVESAVRAGVPVTALGGGHGFHRGISDGIVLRTSGLRSVDVDAGAATVRIGAGTTWHEVAALTGPMGLAPLAGSDPGVGAVGYVLGGGLGPLGRTHGYAADSVLCFEVVTGTGRRLVVDDEHHPDLFWALRGGNHGLGIVTAMTVRLVPTADIHGNAWYFDDRHIEPVLRAWVRWCADLPDEMNTSAQILRVPDDRDSPAAIRGRTVLGIANVHVGEENRGLALASPLLGIATPIFHEPGRVHHDMLPPTVVTDGGVYLDAVDDEALDAILDLVGPRHSRDAVPLDSVGLQRLGGALCSPRTSSNAVTGRGAAFALHAIGTRPDLIGTGIPEHIRALHAAVGRLRSVGTLPNYIGPANAPGEVAEAWEPAIGRRLTEIRAAHDPSGILQGSHTN